MSDIETRVRDELVSRADEAGTWRVGGSDLRRTAARRRSRRHRALAAATVAGTVAAGLALTDGSSPEPDRPPPAALLGAPSPDPSWTDVDLTPEMRARAVMAVHGSSDMTTLVSTRLPGSEQVVAVLLAEDPVGGVLASTVTFASTAPGAELRRGTAAHYRALRSLIAQPAYDGDGAVLVVTVPAGLLGDTVIVTESAPGRDKKDTTTSLTDRLALVPISRPDTVTRIRVLRRGDTVYDSVPADALLGGDVPRTLSRVVVSEAAGRPHQPVQVRTDGVTACRVTAGSFWPQGHVAMPWNLFHDACAPVGTDLRLLLAEDRHNSTVAGLVPPDTRSVRLHWRNGSTSVAPTTWRDEVNAFVDPEGRRADRLVLAEALGPDGAVIASARP